MKPDSASRGTVKTSTILIAVGRGLSVYRKLEEVPPRLRARLAKSTAGANAGTVVIADRRGAQELLRANIEAAASGREKRRPRVVNLLRDDARETLRFILLHRRGLALAALLAILLWLGLRTLGC
jgi:hypothetical protein